MLTFPTPSPSPPPLPPPSPAIFSRDIHHSSALSLLIIAAIIAFVITAFTSIHVLRLLARSRSSSSSSSSSSFSSSFSYFPTLSPLPILVSPDQSEPSDREKVIASLPIFTLSSLQKSQSQSLDCAVCLSNFRPQDELRLLPACRHAFHSQCVDTWLRSTPSCPLCRASIRFHPTEEIDPSRSGSFRVEIGSVSRRAPEGGGTSTGHLRSYSLGSSFEYLVEDDVEAVLERLRRGREGKLEDGIGAEVVGSGRRGWIGDVVDRIASSASSSFNSLRFSGRIGGNQVDLEANSVVEREQESGFAVFYRWLAGV